MQVFITAGEPSGDKLGAALMQGLRRRVPEVRFRGIGGARMIAEGLESLFPMDEISVMGIAEILRDYRRLKARITQTADAVLKARPDLLITVDLPEFSLRVARRVKARSTIRTVHYVAPTVWAWRPRRADRMAGHIDQVLALLPFEPPYMERAGIACDFVGHPVTTEPQADATDMARFRAQTGLRAPFVLMLPGSRRSEVSRLLPIFEAVVARLGAARPELRVVCPAAGPVAASVREALERWRVPPLVIAPDEDPEGALKRAAFRGAEAALAASGTVSLELAAAATPMVIAYDMSWLSRQVIGRMLRVDTVTLVNLVSETRAVPEFIGPACQPGPIVDALLSVLDAPDAQQTAMAVTMERLGRGGPPPGLRAADAVLARLPVAGRGL